MNTVLLDTNIVSYLFKGDTRSALYEPHLLNRELAIAMMTVAELFQ
jgi:tRNA(fMet)-specific endonuclease VapC